jgi:alpha-tubulin suppressor-like RCC1 family protein
VGAGDLFSCLVTASNVPYCWGNNDAGQLGNGLASGSATPVAITSSPFFFSSVTTGFAHACALTADGTPYCWGDNTTGELGNGTTTPSTIPVAVSGGLHFSSISAGYAHTCGVTSAGAAYCWGDNEFGQLGVLGITSYVATPAALAVSLKFASVSAGFDHTCGVANGIAYCWGNNARGQLGTGALISAPTPAAVAGGNSFRSVSAGMSHSCGVTSAGAALCWGANDAAQLGVGTLSVSPSPTAVGGGLTFASVSAGGLYSCGVAAGGAAYCWGDNVYGELGAGATSTGSMSPVAVTGGLAFGTLSAGLYHACGLTTGGTAYCWGDNAQGQLGNGTPFGSAVPVKVAGQP